MKYLFFILCFAFSLNIQKKEVPDANEQYEKFAYVDAIKIYEKVIQKG